MKNKVIPFKGVRYNKDKFKSPGEFVCWPYDIVNKKQQEMFYKKGHYNIIRITLGKEKKNDSPLSNKYTRANEYIKQWIKKKILIKENKPAFYIYRQNYIVPFTGEKKSVIGFIGLVKLQEYKKRKILPHEDTFINDLKDRTSLTRATNTQVSPIYSVYSDKKKSIDHILDNYVKNIAPIYNYKENHSIHHQLWVMTNNELIKKIKKIISKKIIYIGDGHHRYHTMLNYKKEFRKKNKIHRKHDHPVDYIMMYLVNAEHKGLSILPCHRVLYNLGEMRLKKLMEHIKDYFHLKIFTFNNTKEEKKERERFLYLLKSTPSNIHSFGVYIKNLKRFFLLTLKNKEAYLKMATVDHSIAWKSLDVTIIHTLLIDYILHITKKDVSNQIYIDYTTNHLKAMSKVDTGKHQVAIILNPTRINEVIKIAGNSEKMPQKSTYFFPKLLTGLVLYKMENNF